MRNNLKINFYTEEAENILKAAQYSWASSHRCTFFARTGKIEFNEIVAPAGELVIWDAYQTMDLGILAYAIKETLKRARRCNYIYTKNIVIVDGKETPKFDLLREDFDIEDKTLDKYIYLKAFGINENGYKTWYDIEYVKVNIKLAWAMYDLLLNHRKSTIEKTYGAKALERLIGKPRNPMMLEQIKIKNEELNKIQTELDAKIKEVQSKYSMQIKTLEEQRKNEISTLNAEFEHKKLQLNEQFAEMQKLAAMV